MSIERVSSGRWKSSEKNEDRLRSPMTIERIEGKERRFEEDEDRSEERKGES